MSPQPSCGDICQIWTWYSIVNQCFRNWQKWENKEAGENWLSNPHPCLTDLDFHNEATKWRISKVWARATRFTQAFGKGHSLPCRVAEVFVSGETTLWRLRCDGVSLLSSSLLLRRLKHSVSNHWRSFWIGSFSKLLSVFGRQYPSKGVGSCQIVNNEVSISIHNIVNMMSFSSLNDTVVSFWCSNDAVNYKYNS